MLDWEWSDDPNTLSVFIHLLLGVSFAPKRWRGREILPGQIVTSITSLSKKTGMSVRSVRTSLNHLKTTGEVTSESTNGYSVITVVNWAKYQSPDEPNDKRPTSELTSDRQATDKRPTGDRQHRNKGIREEGKKGNNVDTGTEKPASRFTPPTADEATEFCKQAGIVTDVQAFVDHYTSNGWHVGRTPMKDWHAALRNWARRDINSVNARAAPPGKAHYNPFVDMAKEG
ncbi:MAG TPA: hypothetical protein PKN45_11290 [Candidatus Limiplasma sp.]|nr:hypothetical protein [Candidatus Limiplasma sp.]